jgi:arylsulfatase A-like enzyme
MSASVRPARSADRPTHRHCRSWLTRACATTASTRRRSARRRERHCSRGATTTPSTPAASRSWRRGFPGYDGQWPREAACVAEILRGNEYATAAFGKWHNTPDHELGAGGPYDRWPTGKGFDYFYGFQGGESNQWHTPLFENTAPIEAPHDDPKWHFSEALAKKAISWIGQQKAAAPDKPFFVYFAPGAAHAPHHVHKEWADKYKGKFDHGWDRQREITFEKQKKLGLIPKNTKLTPRPDAIPSWNSRSPDEKRLYARMQEVFAGFLEHVDVQIGKLVDAVEQMGLRDDTLIIYVVGDNGPSAEGTLTGTLNVMRTMLAFRTTWRRWSSTSTRSWRAIRESLSGRMVLGRIVSVPLDEAGRFALWRHPKSAWSCRGRNASPIAAGCARSSTTPSTSSRRSSRWRAFPNLAK